MGEQVIHISDTTTPDSAVLDLQSNLNREYFSSASSRKNSIHPADNSELPISLQFQQVSGTGNPQESWLPITASRDGNAFYSAFHSLNSGIGFQVLMLPVAFSILGWTWGIICLSAVFGWQFYTKWLLIQLHEPVSGVRYNRYLNLSKAAFEAMGGVPLQIQCSCGIGLMLRRRSTKSNENWGRWYYKCPLWMDHRGSFYWESDLLNLQARKAHTQPLPSDDEDDDPSITMKKDQSTMNNRDFGTHAMMNNRDFVMGCAFALLSCVVVLIVDGLAIVIVKL